MGIPTPTLLSYSMRVKNITRRRCEMTKKILLLCASAMSSDMCFSWSNEPCAARTTIPMSICPTVLVVEVPNLLWELDGIKESDSEVQVLLVSESESPRTLLVAGHNEGLTLGAFSGQNLFGSSSCCLLDLRKMNANILLRSDTISNCLTYTTYMFLPTTSVYTTYMFLPTVGSTGQW